MKGNVLNAIKICDNNNSVVQITIFFSGFIFINYSPLFLRSAGLMVGYNLNVLGSFMLKTTKKLTNDESDDHSLAEVLPHF